MESPIQNRIGNVFVPVSDMARSIEWYSTIFGLRTRDASHEGTIYDVEMDGETGLVLDANKPVQNSSQPLCFFWTSDLTEARAFLSGLGVSVVHDIEDIGSVSFLVFEDSDGNRLMVCQKN